MQPGRSAKAIILPLLMLYAMQLRAQSASTPRQPATEASGSSLPVSVSVYSRSRVENWQWFSAPPQSDTYSFFSSLLRAGVSQARGRVDWQLELSQPSVLGAPDDAISPVAAQGQMGLGATYYAANGSNRNAAAAFLKQGTVRYRLADDANLRIGRFEFFDGLETKPKDTTIAWLQTNRIAQRLIGNFGFSVAQRSFDGIDGHLGKRSWNLTGFAGRADQGVFNMNGNPELNVDLQYLAFTRAELHQHVLWRAFALGYHDGRTGLTKTDNRPLALRQADHKNIRIGTYGGDILATVPAGPGQFDLLAWGVLQNGRWGSLSQRSKAGALEAGYQFLHAPTAPWVRGGYFYGSGDTNANDDVHKTFFQVLPTPFIYAHFPFYNLMNNNDGFVQVVDRPSKRIDFRADIHWLRLSSSQDLWYQGGGAFDNKVFGYTGRPSNGHQSLATVAELTSSWQATKNATMNFCYGYANGQETIASIYPNGHNGQFGFVEFIYRWGKAQRTTR
jgi:hypothetical protein